MVASGKSGVDGGVGSGADGGTNSAAARKASGPVVMKNGVRVGGYDPSEIPADQHGNYLLHEGRLYEPRKVGTEAIPEVKKHLLAKRGNVLEKIARQLDGAEVSAAMQGAMIREAIREATSSQVTNLELTEFMGSPDGIAFTLWISLRDSMEGLTLEKAEKLFYEITEQEERRRAEMDRVKKELASGEEKSSDNADDDPLKESQR